MSDKKNNWPLWEVFIRSRQGLGHKHVGSLHAADAEMAIGNARDVYTRRQEGLVFGLSHLMQLQQAHLRTLKLSTIQLMTRYTDTPLFTFYPTR